MSQTDTNVNPTAAPSLYPCPPKKLQAKVIIGKGEKQHLVVKEFKVSPPSPPIFRIVDVDKEVVITDKKLIPSVKFDTPEEMGGPCWWSKVIINGYIDKNVIYKTITDSTCEAVNGPLYQFTTRVPFATYLEIKTSERVDETYEAEILSAVVEGEKEELLDPNPAPKCGPDWAVTYNRLLEKMIVRICAKIVKVEDVKVQPVW